MPLRGTQPSEQNPGRWNGYRDFECWGFHASHWTRAVRSIKCSLHGRLDRVPCEKDERPAYRSPMGRDKRLSAKASGHHKSLGIEGGLVPGEECRKNALVASRRLADLALSRIIRGLET
ncbi:hypothetical protein BHE74_00014006 [Ensete ventricosum]|nr:hypothetical protein BHE74_00014006 [Ensete ventricosum]